MLGLVIAALSVVLPLVHLALTKAPRTKARVVRILLLYALVIDVGVMGFVFGFIPHVLFPDQAAKMIGWSLFMLGAAGGHIYQTVTAGNYAPYNFLMIFSDGFIAVWLLVLLYLYHRCGGFQRRGS